MVRRSRRKKNYWRGVWPNIWYARENIQFGKYGYHSAWVAAHEYTHALHHKAMGGLSGLFKTKNCSGHRFHRPSSYECAWSEGLANYGGNVGAPDDPIAHVWALETIRDSVFVKDSGYLPTRPKPKVEAHVAALLHDLIDGATGSDSTTLDVDEPEDKTQYSARYVMKVFATCEIMIPRRGLPHWIVRSDISDFVWCLENRVDSSVHERIFPGIGTPDSAREEATEPSDWNADSIRSTWLWNLDTLGGRQ